MKFLNFCVVDLSILHALFFVLLKYPVLKYFIPYEYES